MLHARLRVPAVPPRPVWEALSDPARLVRWFRQHEPLLGMQGSPEQDAYFRGAYHFWSLFTPHAPPASQHVLLEAHWLPPASDTVRLRYGWTLQGYRSDIYLELAPFAAGSMVTVTHAGLPDELPGIGSSRAYWTLVLENMRLYLLGRAGVSFQQRHPPGEPAPSSAPPGLPLVLAADLVTPAGLDATAAAWEILADPAAHGILLPPAPSGIVAALSEPPHHVAGGGTTARLDWRWEGNLGLPGVLSWRLAGGGSRTRITIVQSGFAAEAQPEHWLTDWRAVLGQLRGQLDLGEDWSQVELD